MKKSKKILIINNNFSKFKKIKKYIKKKYKKYIILEIKKNISFSIIKKYIKIKNIKHIFLLNINNKKLKKIINYSYANKKNLYYNANFIDLLKPIKFKNLNNILMINIKFPLIPKYKLLIKRIIDIIISLIGIILTLPISIIISILIKYEDGGKIFFKQTRLTLNGKKFKIIKFRSMKKNNSNLPAKKNDNRITKIGKIIRKFRLDEIPQFYNVLKGEMSVVGPRPENDKIIKKITKKLPEFKYRLFVKAGITGYAQIYDKYNVNLKKKLILDLNYINNYSLYNDIKLIIKTLFIFFNFKIKKNK